MRWHPNSHYIATGSSDRSIRLWDVRDSSTARVFVGHRSPVSPCCLFCLPPDMRFVCDNQCGSLKHRRSSYSWLSISQRTNKGVGAHACVCLQPNSACEGEATQLIKYCGYISSTVLIWMHVLLPLRKQAKLFKRGLVSLPGVSSSRSQTLDTWLYPKVCADRAKRGPSKHPELGGKPATAIASVVGLLPGGLSLPCSGVSGHMHLVRHEKTIGHTRRVKPGTQPMDNAAGDSTCVFS